MSGQAEPGWTTGSDREERANATELPARCDGLHSELGCQLPPSHEGGLQELEPQSSRALPEQRGMRGKLNLVSMLFYLPAWGLGWHGEGMGSLGGFTLSRLLTELSCTQVVTKAHDATGGDYSSDGRTMRVSSEFPRFCSKIPMSDFAWTSAFLVRNTEAELINPFTPKSDQCKISFAASPVITKSHSMNGFS